MSQLNGGTSDQVRTPPGGASRGTPRGGEGDGRGGDELEDASMPEAGAQQSVAGTRHDCDAITHAMRSQIGNETMTQATCRRG